MYISDFIAAVLRYIFCAFLLIVFLCLEISKSHSEVFRGDVARIADGDTITLLLEDNKKIKVRLLGIDTPELDQPYGKEARDYLMQMILGQQTTCICTKQDRYKRWVCQVLIDDVDVNWMLVRDGFAWWYRYYKYEQSAEDQLRYEEAELIAKLQRIGLWSDEDSVPPWEWRRKRREQREMK